MGWRLSRGDELEELASDLSRAAERARGLGLPTTVYLLSMALFTIYEKKAQHENEALKSSFS